jgi:hypothetical protein
MVVHGGPLSTTPLDEDELEPLLEELLVVAPLLVEELVAEELPLDEEFVPLVTPPLLVAEDAPPDAVPELPLSPEVVPLLEVPPASVLVSSPGSAAHAAPATLPPRMKNKTVPSLVIMP